MASTSRLTYVCAASWGNMCYTWLEKYVDRFFFYTCLRPISLDANNVKPFSVIESQHESPHSAGSRWSYASVCLHEAAEILSELVPPPPCFQSQIIFAESFLLLSHHFNQIHKSVAVRAEHCISLCYIAYPFTWSYCDSSAALTPALPYEVIKPLVVCLAVCMCVLYKTQGGHMFFLP